eukprot:TRINITY_DN24762_c0_g1_i1.p1 TRINITY_DN24762_c0_g1~~TRINITY_DN24762_c0_g1_i1.p1  ORF type:complete len:500 (+),score=92.18 TRINITY_DN24762_c0_g1_i1:91-1590(+)
MSLLDPFMSSSKPKNTAPQRSPAKPPPKVERVPSSQATPGLPVSPGGSAAMRTTSLPVFPQSPPGTSDAAVAASAPKAVMRHHPVPVAPAAAHPYPPEPPAVAAAAATPALATPADPAWARQRSGSSTSSGIPGVPPIPSPSFADISLLKDEVDLALRGLSGPFANRKVRHLVLVIPGIGPHQSKLESNVEQLRKEFAKIHQEHFPQLSSRMIVDFVPFDWQREVHDKEMSEIDGTLGALTLPNLGPIRKFFKDAAMDIIYFCTRPHWRSIVEYTVGGLNAAYHRYCEKHRAEGNPVTVSIYGHSLGGIIAYDVIDSQRDQEDSVIRGLSRLEFTPMSCFTFGSATGLFLAVRGKTSGSIPVVFANGACKYFFNVFHPSDPLACRFEPLTHPAFAHVPPVSLPHWRTLAARRFDDPKAFFRDRRPKEREKSSGAPLVGRYDFELQPKSTQMVDYVSMTSVHTKYWTSADCMLFMVTQLIRQHFLDLSPAGNTQLRPDFL